MYLVDLGNGAVIGAWQEQHNDNGFGANSVHPFTSPSQPGKQLALLDTGDGLWLEVLDITDPANPAILGAVNDAGYAGAFDGLHWFGGDTFAGFSAVDVTDPTNPVQLGFGQGLDGYQGGTAVSADGTRVYQTEWEHGVTIWHTADLVTPPFDAPPVSQGNRGEMRMVLAVENGVGISTQRHTVSKLDASQF